LANSSGSANVAVGYSALANSAGSRLTALGALALGTNTSGTDNVALGYSSSSANTTGSSNVAVGSLALGGNLFGNNNIAIGNQAGKNIVATDNNIDVANAGVQGDSGVIRIGTVGTQTAFFAAGINGVSVAGVPVVVDANGQLGTAAVSSRRFKEEIEDMGDASTGLLRLRPVTFRYRRPYRDGTKPMEYGLVAEEVEQVYPDLVVKSPAGAEAVQYQKLTPLLVNELQKQNRENSELREEVKELRSRLAALEKLLSAK
jgi:hypothetical protein